MLLTKVGFVKNKKSIQQDSFLWLGQESKSYISNGSSFKRVLFEVKKPENVAIYPNICLNFKLPNKSISLSLPSIKNKIEFKKLEFDINSFNHPKSSLRKRNRFNREEFTIEKFRQEGEQNLINIKNEEFKKQQIGEEHTQLEIRRDMLINI